MALMTWNNTYSVGIKSVDDQHAGLFDSLNELHAAMLKGQEKSVTGRLLQDLLAYTRSHFSAEESMLARAKYPDLAAHRLKHQKLTDEVAEYAERYKRGESTLSVHLIHFLRDWLVQHILREDRAYSAWLAQAGLRF
ncbi:MAG TPA: bacteriohemerythrin [Terracidiphilus sp.]|jgi:hemerythrin|nr:bacteriohemerythrin [Terracidiphilus sp.]